MAANEYLQAAAGQLQTAATALKKESDQIRAEFMTYERKANSDIGNMEAEIHAINARLAAGQPDPTEAAMHIRIQYLQRQIQDKKKEIESNKNQMNQAIRAKEDAMNGLMSQSRGLQNQAASLK